MKVSEAVIARSSRRAFLDKPVALSTLREVLALAARAPSGGNLQPWRNYVLGGEPLRQFKAAMRQRLDEHPQIDPPEYDIYPRELAEPYRTQRFQVGESLYRLLAIPREDKAARLAWFGRNFEFFGAPVGLFCFVDRKMGPPQWSDLGMYLQTLMLLLKEKGLDSCAQECWSTYHQTVADFLKVPSSLMLFCGLSIGYADPGAPVNRLVTERMPLDEFSKFIVF